MAGQINLFLYGFTSYSYKSKKFPSRCVRKNKNYYKHLNK